MLPLVFRQLFERAAGGPGHERFGFGQQFEKFVERRAMLRAERRARSRGWPPVRPVGRRPVGPIPIRHRVTGRVLHIVTNALPSTSAGYTVRTHQIAVAQRAAGMDPHVMTECGFPVAQGRLDARRTVDLDGVTYHRLLPLTMLVVNVTVPPDSLSMPAPMPAHRRFTASNRNPAPATSRPVVASESADWCRIRNSAVFRASSGI